MVDVRGLQASETQRRGRAGATDGQRLEVHFDAPTLGTRTTRAAGPGPSATLCATHTSTDRPLRGKCETRTVEPGNVRLADLPVRPRPWQAAILRRRPAARTVVSTAAGNGQTVVALLVAALRLVDAEPSRTVIVAATAADARAVLERVFNPLGLGAWRRRHRDGRRRRSRIAFGRFGRHRRRFRSTINANGAHIENVETGARLEARPARSTWPAGADLIIAVRPGDWPAAHAEQLLDRDAVLVVGPLPEDAEHPYSILARAPDVRRHVFEADPEDGATLKRNWKKANPARETWPAIAAEVDQAEADPVALAAFRRRRLNLGPGGVEDSLITPAAWTRVLERPVPPRSGVPVAGIDLALGRSWTAAVLIWPTGRVEAYALIGGVDLRERERQAGLPRGTLRHLIDRGAVLVDVARRVPDPALLVDHVFGQAWPGTVIADTFQADRVQDVLEDRAELIIRRRRWSESTEDVDAFKRLALDDRDGALAVHVDSAALLTASLLAAELKSDDGNVRLVKRAPERPDDVAQALVLACGELHRQRIEPEDVPPLPRGRPPRMTADRSMRPAPKGRNDLPHSAHR